MSNNLYVKAREKFLRAELAWHTADIKAVLVDAADYTVNLAAHEFLSDIPAPARVATSASFTGKTTTGGVAGAAAFTFTAVVGDSVEALVIIADTGTAATSPLIAYIDDAQGLPNEPNGAPFNVFPDPIAGIFTL